ncbi:MAG: class I SAM-dependent methyltransferase [Planctomycetota bacterium]
MKQRDIFLSGEGDRYFSRNPLVLDDLRELDSADPVLQELRKLDSRFRTTLEIGSGSGWRLGLMQASGMAEFCVALDPSAEALQAGRKNFPDIHHLRGTAEQLPFRGGTFDLIVFGFCLYLCDRGDLPRIAAEATRVLPLGGLAVTFDFHSPVPTSLPYEHAEGVISYKMDYSSIFMDTGAFVLEQQAIFPYPNSRPREDAGDNLAVTLMRRTGRVGS